MIFELFFDCLRVQAKNTGSERGGSRDKSNLSKSFPVSHAFLMQFFFFLEQKAKRSSLVVKIIQKSCDFQSTEVANTNIFLAFGLLCGRKMSSGRCRSTPPVLC